ncbi:MAG: hypothetical protein QW728_07500 [Thermoplasmata archaeon]
MVVKRIQCPGCESDIDLELNVLSHKPSEKLAKLNEVPASNLSPELLEELKKKEKELKKREEELAKREDVVSKFEIELTKKEVELNSRMAELKKHEEERGQSDGADEEEMEEIKVKLADVEKKKEELKKLEADLKQMEADLLQREQVVSRLEAELLKKDLENKEKNGDIPLPPPEHTEENKSYSENLNKQQASLDAMKKYLQLKQEELDRKEKSLLGIQNELLEYEDKPLTGKAIYLKSLIEWGEKIGVTLTSVKGLYDEIAQLLGNGKIEEARKKLEEGIETATSLCEAVVSERAYKKLLYFKTEFDKIEAEGIDVAYEKSLISLAFEVFDLREFVICDRIVQILGKCLADKEKERRKSIEADSDKEAEELKGRNEHEKPRVSIVSTGNNTNHEPQPPSPETLSAPESLPPPDGLVPPPTDEVDTSATSAEGSIIPDAYTISAKVDADNKIITSMTEVKETTEKEEHVSFINPKASPILSSHPTTIQGSVVQTADPLSVSSDVSASAGVNENYLASDKTEAPTQVSTESESIAKHDDSDLHAIAAVEISERLEEAEKRMAELKSKGINVAVITELYQIAQKAYENDNITTAASLLDKIAQLLSDEENEFYRQRASSVISDCNILLKDVGRLIDRDSYDKADAMLKTAKGVFVSKEFKAALKIATEVKDFIHAARLRVMQNKEQNPPNKPIIG